MSTPRSITDLQIFGSNFLRGSRQAHRRGPGTGGRPLKNRSRTLPRLELLEDRMLLTNFFVTSNADTNTGTNATTGTLRYVLNQLDSTVGGSSNNINFASLPVADFTFTPVTALPTITKPVTIEGNTASGFSGTPLIQISGGSAGDIASGLVLGSGSTGTVVESLVINKFAEDGIDIYSSNDSVIGSYIGTNVAGGTSEANVGNGIDVIASGATIGGTSSGDANIISGNVGDGVDIYATCLVEGNLIGTNAAGTAAVANGYNGINLDGSGATIGGTAIGAANIISGNANSGIGIVGSCLVEGNLIGTNAAGTAAVPNSNAGIDVDAPGATIGGTSTGAANIISGGAYYGVYIGAACLVEGNLIGTNAAGTAAVPNAYGGIDVDAPGVTIGGNTSGAANIISGNADEGVVIGASCLVEGNLIGTNAAGTAAVANGNGIEVNVSGATIGGTSPGAANVISGNTTYGVVIDAACLVEGNLIGTNEGGAAAVANAAGIGVGASGATIGGTTSGAANVVSGNSIYGVLIGAACLIEGNLIGTDAAGTAAVANGYGISVGAPGTTIGGTSSGAANIISGNEFGGVLIYAACLVEGNLIGTNEAGAAAVANGNFGIYFNASGATIGGTSAGGGNIIAFNDGSGVATEPGMTGATIRYNAIFSNAGPGIDLNNDGVTPNTPNGATNTPVLTSVAGGIISGTLNASPNSTYLIDFYANLASDASPTRPQGRDYLTSTTVVTNAAGDAVFNVPYTPLPGLPIFTATATDADGTTSEFSPPLGFALTATGATFAATTGVAFQGTVAGFTSSDPAATTAEFTATVNYGDGTASSDGTVVAAPGGFIVVGSHTYTTANPATPVTVTITDTEGGSQATANSLADVTSPTYSLTAASATFTAITNVAFQGTVAGFTSTDPSATTANFTATIVWGDSKSSSTGTVLAVPGGFIVVGSHTYTTANPATPVTVTITDTFGASPATGNSLADVTNLLMPVSQSPVFVAGTLNSAVVASFTDADPQAFPGQFTARIKWGDNTATSPGVVSADGTGFDVIGSHTYNFSTTSTVAEPVTVTITDSLTGATVTVNSTAAINPAPITIQTKNFAVKGGATFSGTVATFTDGDPRIDPTFYTATINWGDGSPKFTGTIKGSNPFTVTSSHKFAPFQNIDLITITITDQNGRTVTGVDRVVDPPAVLDLQAGGLTLSPDKPFVGTVATFTDSGPAEPASDYSATINWGKGRKAAGMITGSNGQFVVSGKNKFSRFSGAKTVSVTVTDITDGRTVSVNESASYAVRHPQVSKAKRPVNNAVKPHRS